MHQYEDLLSYVVSGRVKRMAEVSRQLERTNLVFMSVELYPPANRPTILSLIEEQRNDISVKQKEIQVLDENVEGERSRLQSELVLAMNTVPAPDLNQLVLEFGWPMVDVCQDLNLPYEYVLMARGTYNPTRIATSDNNEKIITNKRKCELNST
ncbi:hypothetical protein G6F23_014029 [Rhizopus arrhizus]|nr:hypothetical protein G6F23_014029 [Rhizopus arrhizus]